MVVLTNHLKLEEVIYILIRMMKKWLVFHLVLSVALVSVQEEKLSVLLMVQA